jgi:hypothetical protein
MSKQRHRNRRSQGGTTQTTTPLTGPGVAQFSVSEVAQFWMSLDKGLDAGHSTFRLLLSKFDVDGFEALLQQCMAGSPAWPKRDRRHPGVRWQDPACGVQSTDPLPA